MEGRGRVDGSHDPGPQRPWGFLTGGIDDDTDEGRLEVRPEMPPGTFLAAAVNDPRAMDLARVYHRAQSLLAAGTWEVTADDFKGVFGGDMSLSADRVRLGLALETLGVRKYRARRAGQEKSTYYDLRPLLNSGKSTPDGAATPPDAVRETSDKAPESEANVEPTREPPEEGGQGRTDGQTYGKGTTGNNAHRGLPDEFALPHSKDQDDLSGPSICRESDEIASQPDPPTRRGEDP